MNNQCRQNSHIVLVKLSDRIVFRIRLKNYVRTLY